MSCDAQYTIARARGRWASMSAIMNWMPWNSAIALPNCLRSLAYPTA